MKANPKKPSGLLHSSFRFDKVTLNLYLPSPDLELYIEHYWIVKWDLRGQEPFVSENLPHPSVHLVIDEGVSQIVGIVKEKFSRLLQEKGFVFGIKFRPGAFYPFVNIPVYQFTGRSIPAHDVFGADIAQLEETILSTDDESEMVKCSEVFIRKRLPRHDESVTLIKTIVDFVMSDREIITVEDIASRFNCSTRMLQRLFKKYVGISPKWVIQRYRLLEVADHLASSHSPTWSQFASDLGYYDQSHFIKDFKSIVGLSPEEYVRKNSRV
ncbi:AraC family transcriptional regulator [Brevibacillus ginsengisoli]|uniref:AraC family transcriptional regulator n=1 Tax=Brevibacillus ginsengisoli TaxID=363854 RepID=UPI003CEEEAED